VGVTDLGFPADACFSCGKAAAIAAVQREAIGGMFCSSDEEQIHAEKIDWGKFLERSRWEHRERGIKADVTESLWRWEPAY